MASTDARPVPIKNTAFRAIFPILDADGDLVTGATGLDSEVSKDQGTFADCTNEATEIATSSGMYYLDLTSTEMNADCVAVIVKTSSSGAKTTVLVFYPNETGDIDVDVAAYGGTAGTFASGRPAVNASHIAGSAVSTSSAQIGVNVVNAAGTAWASGALTSGVFAAGAITAAAIADGAIDRATFAADTGLQPARSNTAQAGAAGTVTLDASASSTTDFYKYHVVYLTGGTGVGQARLVTAYNGTTKVATIAPNWATTPDSSSTFAVLPLATVVDVETIVGAAVSTSTAQLGVNVVNFGGSAGTFASGRPETNTTHIAGSAVSTSTAQLGVNVVNFGGSAGTFASGRPEVNTTHWKGTAAATVDTAGYPVVTVKDGTGAGEIATTSGAVDTVTTLTNAPSDSSGVTTLLSRVPSGIFTGITSLAQWLGLIAGKQTGNSTARTEIRATGAGSGTFDETTDSQEAVRDRGDAAWITATGFSTLSQADVRTAVGMASANLDTQLSTIDDFLDTEIAAIKAKTDNLPSDPADASDIAAAFATVNSTLATIATYIDTEVAAIKAKTDNLPTDPADASDIAASFASIASTLSTMSAYIDTEVAAIKAVTDQFTAAQSEPVAAPAANATPLAKIAWLAALARNKIEQTATTQTLMADDGSTAIATSTVSDDGTTFTRGEFA